MNTAPTSGFGAEKKLPPINPIPEKPKGVEGMNISASFIGNISASLESVFSFKNLNGE